MCMGVFLTMTPKASGGLRLPHVYGGVPIRHRRHSSRNWSSPCVWGCSLHRPNPNPHVGVFPMCMGVFPGQSQPMNYPQSLPHVYGGVPSLNHNSRQYPSSSPCVWGCSHDWLIGSIDGEVFPMCMGVFLDHPVPGGITDGLPHVYGGVPEKSPPERALCGSSPCVWGCSHVIYCRTFYR